MSFIELLWYAFTLFSVCKTVTVLPVRELSVVSKVENTMFEIIYFLFWLFPSQVIAFTYNWAADLNLTFDKQLHRLLNWSNARCHLTSCLLSQKMGLFHHTLFADINRGKEGKVAIEEVNFL